MLKMSIQYTAPEFEPMTLRTGASANCHKSFLHVHAKFEQKRWQEGNKNADLRFTTVKVSLEIFQKELLNERERLDVGITKEQSEVFYN